MVCQIDWEVLIFSTGVHRNMHEVKISRHGLCKSILLSLVGTLWISQRLNKLQICLFQTISISYYILTKGKQPFSLDGPNIVKILSMKFTAKQIKACHDASII